MLRSASHRQPNCVFGEISYPNGIKTILFSVVSARTLTGFTVLEIGSWTSLTHTDFRIHADSPEEHTMARLQPDTENAIYLQGLSAEGPYAGGTKRTFALRSLGDRPSSEMWNLKTCELDPMRSLPFKVEVSYRARPPKIVCIPNLTRRRFINEW